MIKEIFLICTLLACSSTESVAPTPTIHLKSIQITPVSATIEKNKTQQLSATGIYSDDSTQNLTAIVSWSSSNNAIASINNSGLATGISAGTAIITAKDAVSNIDSAATLNVTAPVKSYNHSIAWDSGVLSSGFVFATASTDINLDGINDLAITQYGDSSNSPSITYYKGTDFSKIWQFNGSAGHSLLTVMPQTEVNRTAPVDLDGDGQKEVLLSDSYYNPTTKTGTLTLYIYNALTHALEWKNTYSYTLPSVFYGSITYYVNVEDLDGDGIYEIIISKNANYPSGSSVAYNNWVKVLKGAYHLVAWDSGTLSSGVISTNVSNDIDLDGINDLAITQYGDSSNSPSITYYKGTDFSKIWQFNGSAGHSLLTVMPQTEVNRTAPVDLDGDGQKEVLLSDSYYNPTTKTGTLTLYIYNALTHALEWKNTYNYTVPAGSVTYSSNVEDLNGDGVYEIIVCKNASYMSGTSVVYDNWVKVLKGAYHLVAWDSGTLSSGVISTNVSNDIDLDGINDLAITQYGDSSNSPSITYYKGTNFSKIWQFNGSAGHSLLTVMPQTEVNRTAPVDLDGDGQKEVLLSDSYYNPTTKTGTLTLYIYNVLTHTLEWKNTYSYTLPPDGYGYILNYSNVNDIDGDGIYEIIITQSSYHVPSSSSTVNYNSRIKILK